MLTENIQSREEGVNLKEIDVELKKQKSVQVCLILYRYKMQISMVQEFRESLHVLVSMIIIFMMATTIVALKVSVLTTERFSDFICDKRLRELKVLIASCLLFNLMYEKFTHILGKACSTYSQ